MANIVWQITTGQRVPSKLLILAIYSHILVCLADKILIFNDTATLLTLVIKANFIVTNFKECLNNFKLKQTNY